MAQKVAFFAPRASSAPCCRWRSNNAAVSAATTQFNAIGMCEHPFSAIYIYINDHFAKTGWGQS